MIERWSEAMGAALVYKQLLAKISCCMKKKRLVTKLIIIKMLTLSIAIDSEMPLACPSHPGARSQDLGH